MRSLIVQALQTLESQLLKWNDQDVQYETEKLIALIKEFYKHSAPVARQLPRLAEQGFFQSKKKLCALFLPTFLRSETLQICLQHGFEMIKVLFAQSDLIDPEIFGQVLELELEDKCGICDKLFPNVVNREERLALRVGELFSMFPNLEVLKFRGYQFPKILLEQVVCHFPKLKELDFFRDWLTSQCVEQLSRLVHLTHLHFYSMHICDNIVSHPRFLLENATRPIYVNDILLTNNETIILESVLTSLPNSVALSCSRVAMTDAARILQLCESRFIELRTVYILFWDSSNYNFTELGDVFPNVKTLRFCDSALGQDTEVKLGKFPNVRDLAVSESLNSPSLGVIGCNLRQLEVWMDKLLSSELIVMSEQCPNVTYLLIGGNGYTETPARKGKSIPLVPLPFPRLHTLIYYFDDLSGLHIFMNVRSKLVRLYAFDYFSPKGRISDNRGVIQTLMTKPGAWPKLVFFHVSNLIYSIAQVIYLVRALPSLQYVLMKVPKCDDGRTFISPHGQTVRLLMCPELHILPSESEFYTWDDRWFSGPSH